MCTPSYHIFKYKAGLPDSLEAHFSPLYGLSSWHEGLRSKFYPCRLRYCFALMSCYYLLLPIIVMVFIRWHCVLPFTRLTCCVSLNENGPYRIIYLKAFQLNGSQLVELFERIWALWPYWDMCQWEWALRFPKFTSLPTPPRPHCFYCLMVVESTCKFSCTAD